jgi:hypothetical protein
MELSQWSVVGLFGLLGLLVNVVIPILVLVLLFRILGRLDDIVRRLDGAGGVPRRTLLGGPEEAPDRG